MGSRFDYVAYDEQAMNHQAEAKAAVQVVEGLAGLIGDSRWREAALMKLEECYMCFGKGIRDDQISRNGSAPLQEGRGKE